MPLNSSSVHSLRRVFMQAFVVHDIAEPLVSFDDFASTKQVLAFMTRGDLKSWVFVGKDAWRGMQNWPTWETGGALVC